MSDHNFPLKPDSLGNTPQKDHWNDVINELLAELFTVGLLSESYGSYFLLNTLYSLDATPQKSSSNIQCQQTIRPDEVNEFKSLIFGAITTTDHLHPDRSHHQRLLIKLLQKGHLVNLRHLQFPLVTNSRTGRPAEIVRQKGDIDINNLYQLLLSLPKLTSIKSPPDQPHITTPFANLTKPLICPNITSLDVKTLSPWSKDFKNLVNFTVFPDLTTFKAEFMEVSENNSPFILPPRPASVLLFFTLFPLWYEAFAKKLLVPLHIPVLQIRFDQDTTRGLIQSPLLSVIDKLEIRYDSQGLRDVAIPFDVAPEDQSQAYFQALCPKNFITSEFFNPSTKISIIFDSLKDGSVIYGMIKTWMDYPGLLKRIVDINFNESWKDGVEIPPLLVQLYHAGLTNLEGFSIINLGGYSDWSEIQMNDISIILHASPLVTNVTNLNIPILEDKALQLLTTSPYLSNLKSLQIDLSHISIKALHNIVQSKTIKSLEDVFIDSQSDPIEHSSTTEEQIKGITQFLKSSCLSSVKNLVFESPPSISGSEEIWQAFGESTSLKNLVNLQLSNHCVDDNGKYTSHLFNSPHLSQNLTELLFNCDLTDDDLYNLAQCPALTNLTSLSLPMNPRITTKGIENLANSPYLRKLTYLFISENENFDASTILAFVPTKFQIFASPYIGMTSHPSLFLPVDDPSEEPSMARLKIVKFREIPVEIFNQM